MFILPVLVLFLINIASAQTLTGGKIYSSDFNNPIADASVIVSCEHDGQTNSLATSSVGDGTYAVIFKETECNEGDLVTVTAEKGDFFGEDVGKIKEYDGEEGNFVAIINILMQEVSDNNGGNSGNGNTGDSNDGGGGCIYNEEYDWDCSEWGECIEGLQARTCKKTNNCGNTYGRPSTSRECDFESEKEQNQNSENIEQSFLSGITGAVTGTLGNTGILIIILFLICILIIWFIIKIFK